MKRLLSTLMLLAICAAGFAQDKIAGIGRMIDEGKVDFSYKYDVDGKIPIGAKGTATVQGECYMSRGNGLSIYCDGKTRWTVDEEAKEVYIEEAVQGEVLETIRTYASHAKNLQVSSTDISGSFVSDDGASTIHFRISGITPSEKTEDLSIFKFNTSGLGSDWVVTDLR